MIYNLGSINRDIVYGMAALPKAGETVSADTVSEFLGGKGINQSIAVAQAGQQVRHIGAVNKDDAWVRPQIESFGVSTDNIAQIVEPTGHAVIAVDKNAENQIIIFSGANQAIPQKWMQDQLSDLSEGDFVLCQNETNLTTELGAAAKERGAKLVLSAAPFDADQVTALRPNVHLLAVNELEAAELSQTFGQAPEEMGFPMLLVTRGSEGATVYAGGEATFQASFKVTPVDTTGAGDTFLGSFVARLDKGEDNQTALRYASAAAALQVTKHGAAAAIPSEKDVLDFLKENA